jgi:hypothetical protein
MEAKFSHYTRGRENYLSETLHQQVSNKAHSLEEKSQG